MEPENLQIHAGFQCNVISGIFKDSAPGDVCAPGNEVWVYEEKLYLSANSKSVDRVEMWIIKN